MTTIPPVGDTSGAQTASGSSTSGLNQLDNSQTFLQLLVAQLQNQDPDNPTDPTSFMTEIAQLTAVQSQTSLSSEEQVVAADSMIGRQVTGTATDGSTVSGVVSSVLLSNSGAPTLQVGNEDLALTSISEVSQAPDPGGS
ncbi:MAG TPA: flagellar hook capping FlgD N-terminal domain-containing protein [Acidimicrobiales bacterium]|nr:flagellar hook capping FlgD N-terminal domain-containing protein [Acidimicrobiales bacterium]